MCEELEISRDAYYKWLKRKDNKNIYELNHESLKPLIQKYYDISTCIGKSLNNDFIEYNLDLLNNSDYKLNDIILHSDRGGMYKSSIYNTKTAEMNLIPSLSAPYACTHNPWIETLNG